MSGVVNYSGESLWCVAIAQVATHHVSDRQSRDVIEMLRNLPSHTLLVYDDQGHFNGIVTPTDFLAAIAGGFGEPDNLNRDVEISARCETLCVPVKAKPLDTGIFSQPSLLATSMADYILQTVLLQEVPYVRAIINRATEIPLSFFKMLRALPFALAGLASIVVPVSGMADTSAMDAQEDLLQQGEYVARAGNCLSCHGEDLAGGYEVHTPLGAIVATNISPSKEFGIGHYSSDDFARAIREGVAPGHRLYPAMPYASYAGMSDEDVNALYLWTMNQPAVDESPQQQTELPFPFNIRMSMIIWNAIFLDGSVRLTEEQSMVERGSYLVNHLGHCGECHTPRNALYAPDADRHLAGALVDGWLAPNLTSDTLSGIGAWSEEALVEYLQTGYADDIAQAAGSMAKVVQHGTRFLKIEDLQAIAAYLMSVEPISNPAHTREAFLAPDERVTPTHTYNQIREDMTAALARDDLSAVEQVYLRECASCHGVNGQGQPEAYYPPLVDNLELRRADPTNVVQSIASGIEPGALYRTPGMPGFGDILSQTEIAELANHLRKDFGGLDDSALTATDVDRVLNEQPEPPMLIRLAPQLAWTGIILLALLLGFVIWRVYAHRRHASDSHGALSSASPTRSREQEA